ncbi:MAG: YgjV family protein [Alphaproteobacteria bacterium]|nr:YgjV family protein [Alphaproteobacteria bacterium]
MALLTSFAIPHMPGRRPMLWINATACFLFSAYFFTESESAAMFATMIAGTSSVLQAAIPSRLLGKTLRLRLGIALVMVTISILVSYHGPADFLPMAAVVMARFSETFGSQRMIRYGNLFPTVLWIYFAMMQGLYGVAIGDTLLLLSYLIGVWRDEALRSRQRRILAAAVVP